MSGGGERADGSETVCWLCGRDLNDLNENQRNEHVSSCLGEQIHWLY